jgi:hypothetical protein
MVELLGPNELPDGFIYPRPLVRMAELGLLDLEPWEIMEGMSLRARFAGMRQRYPQRTLVPFARRQDNDDVACFDLDRDKVTIIHDFASSGWEDRAEFTDFRAWLHQAIDDLIAFE